MAALTGHPCPGCGLTRATLALFHGHVREALSLHPLAPLIAPVLAASFLYVAVTYVREGRVGDGKAVVRLAGAGLALWVLLLGVWIARFFGAFGGPVAV